MEFKLGDAMTRVLDHGSVRLVESWGSDERIIEAARMSTGKGFEGWGPKECSACRGVGKCGKCGDTGKVLGDERLLAYLWHNKHSSPFEMAGAVFEVEAPIFVFREWHRHRTQSYNEHSARYAPLPAVDYMPTVERLLSVNNTGTKQAAALTETNRQNAEWFCAELFSLQKRAQAVYQLGLDTGVPKELARLALTVGRYSKMRASANLLNWTKFLTLREAPTAQWEIQQYAHAVADMLAHLFPRTIALYRQSR